MGGQDSGPLVPSDDGARLEVEELGETPIRRDLMVPPTPLGPRERGPGRIDPRLIVVVAIAIIAVGLAGTRPSSPATPTDPPPTDPVAIASPSPGVTTTATPDPCPGAGLPAPSVRFGTRNGQGVRIDSPDLVASIGDVGFSAPVERTLETRAGERMVLDPGDARCVDAFDLVLFLTADGGTTSVSVTDLRVLDGDFLFDAPPTGDWVIRLGLRLRGPTSSTAPWAVYLFRLNAGYVPWVEPIPHLGPSPDPPVDPLVVPVLPCGDGPADVEPIGVDLVLADGRRVAGVLGDYVWDAFPTRAEGIPDLTAVEPIDLGSLEPITFRTDDDICAVRWSIRAWPDPAAGEVRPFDASWAAWLENPLGDPRVAAQNVFELRAAGFGTVIIEARLDFGGPSEAPLKQESVYWKARLGAIAMPTAVVSSMGAGPVVDLMPVCGVGLQSGDGWYVGEQCDESPWPALADLPVISVATGDVLGLSVTGLQMTDWWVAALDSGFQPGYEDEGPPHLAYGGSTGQSSVAFPAPAPGDWRVFVQLSVARDGYTLSVRYQVRILVTE